VVKQHLRAALPSPNLDVSSTSARRQLDIVSGAAVVEQRDTIAVIAVGRGRVCARVGRARE
jgi:hypothetical protein